MPRSCSSETAPELIKKLVRLGADIEYKAGRHNYTPLQVAVSCNCLRSIKTLIECGANVNVCDDHGNTLLHLAIMFETLQAYDWLVANTDLKEDLPNKAGATPRNCKKAYLEKREEELAKGLICSLERNLKFSKPLFNDSPAIVTQKLNEITLAHEHKQTYAEALEKIDKISNALLEPNLPNQQNRLK